ncbi:ABC transporter permease [Suicoccus acidiformans]|uniref:ABC transporter permease n=1 Tax=Suicoccus acidiformans TaxID=2036206 RepID=A0A347WJ36_9LACT|nr:energy-coupling factor transporter transmembrane component T [Suicoccus acidiformans]AXY25093.1 ABC transporter permease [Suicoccus acidiformans]
MQIHFDPRAKLVLLLLGPLLVDAQLAPGWEVATAFIYWVPFLLSGRYRMAVNFGLVYALQWFIMLWVIPRVESDFLLFSLTLFASGNRKMMPGLMAGFHFIATTSVGEMTSLLKRWRVPNGLVTMIAVMMRFFPTIYQDYQQIRDAMALRGIHRGFWGALRHPVRTFEYILVPMLMNASRVAQDITVSALTKGISLPGRHTSLISLKMGIQDWLLILLALVPFVAKGIGGL